MLEIFKSNWQVIIAISTTVIALCALVLTVFQHRSNIKHQKISVRPILRYNEGFEGSYFWIKITNVGLGPAIITKVIIQKKVNQIHIWIFQKCLLSSN